MYKVGVRLHWHSLSSQSWATVDCRQAPWYVYNTIRVLELYKLIRWESGHLAVTGIICPALQFNSLAVWPHLAAAEGCTCRGLPVLLTRRGEEAAGIKLIQLRKIQRHCSVKQAKLIQSQQFRNVPHEKLKCDRTQIFNVFFILENVGKIKKTL